MIIEKNLMVFGSTPDFADNSRGFWEYINANTNYDTCWVIKDKNMIDILTNKGINCVLDGTDEANEVINKAHYLITSSFDFAYNKKIGQIHIAAWHGFPLKVIGFFDSAAASKNNFEGLKVITTQTDLITATSRFSHLTLSGMFAVDPHKVKETGYPRNDLMFNNSSKQKLQKLLDVDISRSKLFFYLPTMRKGLKDEGEHFENNIFNYVDYDVKKLDDFLEKNNIYIVAKVHFEDNSMYRQENFRLPKRLILLNTEIMNTNLCTIYHIMNAFDGLITDYSSIYADYLLLNKPIIFSCPDIEKYKNDRGFVVDNPALLMPGVIVKSQDELMYHLNQIIQGNDVYKNIREEKLPFFHNHVDGNASKRLLDEILKVEAEGLYDSGKIVGQLFQKNVTPLDQYITNEINAEIFFDFGNGFSEQNKLLKTYQLNGDNKIFNIELDINEHVKMVRLDPDEIGRVIIEELEIYLDGRPMDNYIIIGGRKYNDKVVFSNVDPQILIPVDVQDKKKLIIRFKYDDFYIMGGKIIEQIIKENELNYTKIMDLKNELQMVYNSKSWKMTKWYRKLRDLMKK